MRPCAGTGTYLYADSQGIQSIGDIGLSPIFTFMDHPTLEEGELQTVSVGTMHNDGGTYDDALVEGEHHDELDGKEL